MWPEFDAEDLAQALASFRRRERRFGGLAALPLEPAPSL
jgi:undecaprenyl diphosphate synthase